jgi:hypothetical protein
MSTTAVTVAQEVAAIIRAHIEELDAERARLVEALGHLEQIAPPITTETPAPKKKRGRPAKSAAAF